jgi:hypothetical protein
MWNRQVFLKTDVKTFFGRVCADGLSDSDIAAIIEEYTKRLAQRKQVRPHFIYAPSLVSYAQFASAGKIWEELQEAEREETKERLKSLHYEKCDEHPYSGTRVDLRRQSYRKAQGRRVGRGTGTAPIHLRSVGRYYRSQGRKNPHR